MSSARLRASSEVGASAVEFAVLLPLLLVIVFGIIAFGQVFHQTMRLDNAARQGARLGAVTPVSCADVRAEVVRAVGGGGAADDTIDMDTGSADWSAPVVRRGANEATATVQCAADACDGSSPGDKLYVTAQWDIEITIPLVLDVNRTLAGVGAFRCEYR